jgi:GTPase SAR1 family protein
MIFIYFIGTAGSGKSHLTRAFQNWCELQSLNTFTVNLDPGVQKLPYTPDVDVREWIDIDTVMSTYGLGPNGAQIACGDLLALDTPQLKDRIMEYRGDYVLLDTPGQLELFVFRRAGKVIVEYLHPKESLIAFLMDPALVTTPSSFVSQLMLSAITHFRFHIPLVNVLSKKDLLEKESLEHIMNWGTDPQGLYGEVLTENPSLHRQLSEGIITLLNDMAAYTSLTPVSSKNLEGLEDLYTIIQNIFSGGEDLVSD